MLWAFAEENKKGIFFKSNINSQKLQFIKKIN